MFKFFFLLLVAFLLVGLPWVLLFLGWWLGAPFWLVLLVAAVVVTIVMLR